MSRTVQSITLLDITTGLSVDINVSPDIDAVTIHSLTASVNGRLAFATWQGYYEGEIYVWDGNNLTLVSDSAYGFTPAWQVDGTLVFWSNSEWNMQFYLWDGSSLVYETFGTTDFTPARSAEGYLAFESVFYNEFQISVWNDNVLTNVSRNTALNFNSSLNVDTPLVFVSTHNGNGEIYIWDGSSFINISQDTSAIDISPSLSMDGRIAFVSDRDGNNEIYVWENNTLTNISQHPAEDTYPIWSKDGRLAFVSNRDGNQEIYIWDGSSLTNITNSPVYETSPVWWSP